MPSESVKKSGSTINKEDNRVKMTVESSQAIVDSMTTPEFRNELIALLKIHYPVIYMTCGEEKRMINFFKHLAVAKNFNLFTWDCYEGVSDALHNKKKKQTTDDRDEEVALDNIIKEADSKKDDVNIYILLDFHTFLTSPRAVRALKKLFLFESKTSVIITGPCFAIPDELQNSISKIEFPLPNKDEVTATIEAICSSKNVKRSIPKLYENNKDRIYKIVNSVSGLTLHESQKALAKSIVVYKDFNIKAINEEKKQIISQKGCLEYFDPEVTMDDVGGLENIIEWLKRKQLAFHPDAKGYGLPPLRGFMVAGVPGTGKSLIVKAAANMFDIPLLRLDFGTLFKPYVGESENSAREVTKIAEALAPCLLWIDEIEKGISGIGASSQTNSGVTDRVVGTFLTWLQEKKAQVFVACTANNHEQIPPEFLRAGRFDEIFFVDFPAEDEIKQIYTALIRKKKRNPDDFDIESLIPLVKNITGAEIEKAIDMALFEGFADNRREPTTADIAEALGKFSPLYKMRPEYFDAMLDWADKNGWVRANKAKKDNSGSNVERGIDIDLND